MLRRNTAKVQLAVLVVILFAAAIRVIDLDRQDLWIDETFSLWVAGEPAVSGAVQAARDDVHPPLYFVLLGFWTRAAGYSELAGRYFSAMASVLSVAFTYALGRRMFGARVGLWSGAALAAAGMHVRYARELRMYALLALLAAASTWAYLRWREQPDLARALIYWALAAALPYTHYYGGFVLLAHTLHLLATGRRRWRGWLVIQAGVWGAFLPWLPALTNQSTQRPAGLHHAIASNWRNVEWLLNMLTDDAPRLVIGLAAVGVAGAVIQRRWSRQAGQGSAIVLLLLWLLVPLVGGLLLNLRMPSLTLRNLIVMTPALALLVGLGVSRLPRLARPLAAWLVVVSALVAYAGLYPPNLHWRDFVREMAGAVRAGDVLLYHLGPAPISHPFEYYRRREPAFEVQPVSLFDLPGPPSAAAFKDALRDLAADEPRVWVATSYETPINWYTFMALRETHSLSRQEHFYSIDMYLFEPPPVPPSEAVYRLGEAFTLTPAVRSSPPYRPGDVFEVELAWDALTSPEVDYSVGLHLVNQAFKLSAQADAYPDPPTSTWEAGGAYRTVRRLALPAGLPPGRYDVHLVVYTWWDTARLWVWDANAPLLLGDYILLDTLVIEAQ